MGGAQRNPSSFSAEGFIHRFQRFTQIIATKNEGGWFFGLIRFSYFGMTPRPLTELPVKKRELTDNTPMM
jgi:hypothetical protein